MNETRELCEFIEGISYDKLPDNAILMAKRCLIDYIGSASFAAQTEMGRIIKDVGSRNNSGHCTMLPESEHKYAPNMAALVNGTLGHGFELDDLNSDTVAHCGCEICSASIAMCEEFGADGKTLIEAIIAGYEVMVRSIKPFAKHHVDKGFHPTATGGTFGATAACCKVLGLNADQIENALGIAGSFTSGIKQFAEFGSMSKRLHGGMGGERGAIIAQLAKEGFTGPKEIFEGKYGFNRLFADSDYHADFSLITKDLGNPYIVEDITVKPSAACGVLHSSVDCLNEIARKNPDFVKDFDAIEKIVVHSHHNMLDLHMKREPLSVLQGQNSDVFIIGIYMEYDVQDAKLFLNDDIIKDQKVLRWSEKIEGVLDAELDAGFPSELGAQIDVIMKNGKTFTARFRTPKGSGEQQFSYEEVEGKYRVLAKGLYPDAQIEDIADKVRNIEKLANVRDLFDEKFINQ